MENKRYIPGFGAWCLLCCAIEEYEKSHGETPKFVHIPMWLEDDLQAFKDSGQMGALPDGPVREHVRSIRGVKPLWGADKFRLHDGVTPPEDDDPRRLEFWGYQVFGAEILDPKTKRPLCDDVPLKIGQEVLLPSLMGGANGYHEARVSAVDVGGTYTVEAKEGNLISSVSRSADHRNAWVATTYGDMRALAKADFS